jgi:succinate dehydrogenase / fumarate reductase cytochrome b subunit
MERKRLEYRRKVSSIRSWMDFSARHVAFALHRVTGWLLLGWVVVHLGVPTVSGGLAVWNPLVDLGEPAAEAVVVGLFAVLIFHSFNGIRLIAAELFGVGIATARRVFLWTLVLSVVLLVAMGVFL